MKVVRLGALLLAVAVASACASPLPPLVSQQELEQAQAAGGLAELYDRLETQLTALEPARAEAHRERMAEVGEVLAAELEAQLRVDLDGGRSADGQVSLEVLAKAAPEGAPLARWAPGRAAAWTILLAEEERLTRAAMEIDYRQLAALDADQIVERLAILERLAVLAGSGAPEAESLANERSAALESLRARVAEAVEAENYTGAHRLLRTAREIDPSDTSLSERLADVDSRAVEQRFWMALEDGDPGVAFGLLEEAAASEDFPAIRTRLQPSARVMADYFGELAATATSESRLGDAYRELQRASAVAAFFGGADVAQAPRLAFVERLEEEASSAASPAASWGFLRIAEEFSQSTPALRRKLREARENVERSAVRRLSALPFEDSSGGADFGETVGGRVVEYLMDAIPNDVRIVEREQLPEVLREKEIAAAGKGAGARLASADFLVQGTILEAKVDSSESVGRKTVRVVTGKEMVANPDYVSWSAMSEKAREKTSEPVKTISVEKREDVTIRLTAHRKVGILAASYRIIDAVSAKVLLADSVREKEKVQDESSEGVELGDFRMEFKLADLPSDLEILNELADRVSKSIGEHLAEFLGDAEKEHAARATELDDEGDFAQATKFFAAALVIAERKGDDVGDLLSRLKQSAMASADAAVPASN